MGKVYGNEAPDSVNGMKVPSTTIRRMVKECTHGRMATAIKGLSKMIYGMATEKCIGVMGVTTKDNG